MKGFTLLMAGLSLSLCFDSAFAQKVYKCTSSTGVVTFTHDPCGADAKEVDTSKANKHSAAHDRTDVTNAVAIDDMDHECIQRIDNISRNANSQISEIGAEIKRLRHDMEYSKNNLAGAQRDTGIQTQITGLEARISAMETTRDNAVLTAQETCRLRREAELQRQDAEKQRKADALKHT